MALAALLVATINAPLNRQASSSAVNGTVTDPQGAIVPGAQVVLTSVETGIEHRSETNAGGRYVYVNTPPG